MSTQAAPDNIPLFLYENERQYVEDAMADQQDIASVIAIVEAAESYAKSAREQCLPPDTPPVACKEGCDWCCHQSVRVSPPEVFRIVRHILDLPAAQQTELRNRLNALDARIRGRSPQERGQLVAACAFLKAGGCSIYSVRPLICQTVTSFNAQDCERAMPKGFPLGSIQSERVRHIVYGSIISGMHLGFEKALDPQRAASLELTSAVVIALNHEDAFAAWLAGQPVFEAALLVPWSA